MDFSHQYFAQAQPYQFMGIPPLTPSHSNSAGSDDFNTTSPPDVYAEYPNDQHFNSFENYAPAQFNPQHTSFPGPPGPPTPPNHLPVQQPQPPQQPPQHNGMPAPPVQQIKPQPEVVVHKQEPMDDHSRRGGSNSDDEDLTPAQSRRKAQNRAAQRAFRERKEKHVKDLEAKLANLEAEAQRILCCYCCPPLTRQDSTGQDRTGQTDLRRALLFSASDPFPPCQSSFPSFFFPTVRPPPSSQPPEAVCCTKIAPESVRIVGALDLLPLLLLLLFLASTSTRCFSALISPFIPSRSSPYVGLCEQTTRSNRFASRPFIRLTQQRLFIRPSLRTDPAPAS